MRIASAFENSLFLFGQLILNAFDRCRLGFGTHPSGCDPVQVFGTAVAPVDHTFPHQQFIHPIAEISEGQGADRADIEAVW